MNNLCIDVKNLNKYFGEHHVVKDFSLQVGFVNGMVASHLLCHSGTINRHSLNGALLS